MKKVFTAFKEHKEFNNNNPWDVNLMVFPGNEVVPPHYAETIEVLLCRNLKGKINIGTRVFNLGGNQAFYIAPEIIHSMNYEQNDGKLYVLKLEPNHLKKYIDINVIIKDCGMDISQLCCLIDDFDAIESITAGIADNNISIAQKLNAIITLLDILIKNSDKKNDSLPAVNDKDLYSIINWTEQNFKRHITLDEIADTFGYNKYYFCNKFKKAVGTTYLNYLNTLRISHACTLLQNGNSVNSVCTECGFENLPYFIQLFKKHIGITPKKYSQTV